MHFLFLFMDGIGLGANDPLINPFAQANLPHLGSLLGSQAMTAGRAPYHGPQATLLALDACLGVAGQPQSATGQAVLLTGQNVPAALGYHYGPKPDPATSLFLKNGNLFSRLQQAGCRAGFLNAYPPRYFEAIQSGRRMYSAIPMAATSAGLTLNGQEEYRLGRALSADFTGRGWRDHLGIQDAPFFEPFQAGQRLAALAETYDFAFFEYWMSDYAGHAQEMDEAVVLLESWDLVLGGLLSAWNPAEGLILVTSDHGNLEDLSTRRHTLNPVPGLVIGAPEIREPFASQLQNITDVAPAILSLFPKGIRTGI